MRTAKALLRLGFLYSNSRLVILNKLTRLTIYYNCKIRTKIWKVNLTVLKKTETLSRNVIFVFSIPEKDILWNLLNTHCNSQIISEPKSLENSEAAKLLPLVMFCILSLKNSFWLGSLVNSKWCSQPPVQLKTSKRTLELSQKYLDKYRDVFKKQLDEHCIHSSGSEKIEYKEKLILQCLVSETFLLPKKCFCSIYKKESSVIYCEFSSHYSRSFSELLMLYDRVNNETPK